MTRLAVFNQKGGVGKTTTTLNLAAALARRQVVPLLVDLDAQAHLSQILAPAESPADSVFAYYSDAKPLRSLVRPVELAATAARGELVPAHSELMKVDSLFGRGPTILNRLKQGLDDDFGGDPPRAVFIDCCPILGVLSLSGVFAAERVLVPVSADFLAMKGALALESTLKALEHVLKKRVERRYVLTRFDSRRRMAHDIEASLRERFGAELCTTRIAESVGLAESPYHRRDIFAHDAKSRGARDYEQLLEELLTTGFLEV
jgi:chromosome partitioning protein